MWSIFRNIPAPALLALPEVGRTIEVVSCPRRFDHADGFAGWTGKVASSDNTGVEVEREGGGVLIICSPGWRRRLKWKYLD
jgi:hypothetical protein